MPESLFVAKQTGAGLTGYVIVEAKSDFPAPAAGIIQLADNTVYQVNGTIFLGGDRLVYGAGTIVMGIQNSHDILVYTGVGALVSAAGGNNLRINDLAISAAAGAAFDVVDAPNVSIEGVVGSALRFGRFEDCDTIVSQQSSIVGVESGIELVNSTPGSLFAMLNGRISQHVGATGVVLDLGTSVWNSFQVTEVELISAVGGTDISGLAANGNLTPTIGRGRVFSSIINGLGTHLAGIDVNDIQWTYHNNTGLADSTNVGALEMEANATETVIAVLNTFVKVAGTTVLTQAKRFDAGDPVLDNNLRSTGLTPLTGEVSADVQIEKSGASKIFSLRIFKNGAGIGFTHQISVTNQASDHTVSVVDDLTAGDEYDVRIANTVDTDNATVTDMSVSATGI